MAEQKATVVKMSHFGIKLPKKVVAIILAVIIVIAAGTLLYMHAHRKKPPFVYHQNPSIIDARGSGLQKIIAQTEQLNISSYSAQQKILYYAGLANLYDEAKNYQQEVATLNKALAIQQDPYALERVGDVEIKLGDKATAKSYYLRSLAAYQAIANKTDSDNASIARVSGKVAN